MKLLYTQSSSLRTTADIIHLLHPYRLICTLVLLSESKFINSPAIQWIAGFLYANYDPLSTAIEFMVKSC